MKWGWVAEPGAEGLLEEVTEQGLQRVGSELCILDVGPPGRAQPAGAGPEVGGSARRSGRWRMSSRVHLMKPERTPPAVTLSPALGLPPGGSGWAC